MKGILLLLWELATVATHETKKVFKVNLARVMGQWGQ
jgi:hypothetical protein